MPYDEDTVRDMACGIAANMPIGHQGEYLNAMMMVILSVLTMNDTKPERVKEMFTHFYREYCKGLEDNDD